MRRHQRNVVEYYNCMDLFILPSLIEGTPISILEAMSCNLDVLVSKVGGVPDIVEEGKTGYFLSMEVESDCEKINNILKRPNLNPRWYVVENHSIENVRNEFLKCSIFGKREYSQKVPGSVIIEGYYV